MPKTAWSGRTRFLADVSKESAEEISKWTSMQRTAEKAREIESDTQSLWSFIGTAVALPFVGPLAPFVGAITGNIAKGVRTWKDEPIESYKMDTSDVGKWDQAEDLANLEAINREFEAYDKAEFWEGMYDIGKAGLFALQAGGGLNEFGMPTGESMANWSPTRWGGKTGLTTGEVVGSWFDSPDATTSGVGIGSTFGKGPGMSMEKHISSLIPSAPGDQYLQSISPFKPSPLSPIEKQLRDMNLLLEDPFSSFEENKANYWELMGRNTDVKY